MRKKPGKNDGDGNYFWRIVLAFLAVLLMTAYLLNFYYVNNVIKDLLDFFF